VLRTPLLLNHAVDFLSVFKNVNVFFGSPSKLQLVFSAQMETVLSFAFTLVRQVVKNSFTVAGSFFRQAIHLTNTGKILVSLWFDASGITEMKLAFCMLDRSSERVKDVSMFKTIISSLVWAQVNFGSSRHWISEEVEPMDLKDCVALCGMRMFLQ
jgi:hypothetical protein